MFRELRLLGIVLAAVLTAAASTATAASAAQFHSETNPVDLTGAQPPMTTSIFAFGSNKLTCDAVTLTGTSTAGKTTTSLRVHPQFTASEVCTFAGTQFPVKTTGCDAVLAGELEEVEFFMHGKFSLECEGGKFIIIELPLNCKLEMGSQQVYGLDYVNYGLKAEREVLTEVTVAGLTYRSTGTGCFLAYGLVNGGTYSNMSYTAWWTIKAYEPAEHSKQVGLWHE